MFLPRRREGAIMADTFYAALGAALIAIGFSGFVVRRHLFWKIIALNITGTGIFLLLLTLPVMPAGSGADPVPQAMVLTGIVVTVAATALALALALRLAAATGEPRLPEETGSS
jgi:multicomponent Na+:H+ antiporter subunit C